MKVKQFSTNLFFNGEFFNIQTYTIFTLEDLIKFFDYKQNLIVIEYNGQICHPKKWSTIKIKNKDKIELVTIVGGG